MKKLKYSTENYYETLSECYFYPEARFKSEAIKNVSRKAMEYLWDKGFYGYEGKTYGREEIRQLLIEEMMPEILDKAVDSYVNAEKVDRDVPYLAACIFRTLLSYDTYIERLFRKNAVKHGLN